MLCFIRIQWTWSVINKGFVKGLLILWLDFFLSFPKSFHKLTFMLGLYDCVKFVFDGNSIWIVFPLKHFTSSQILECKTNLRCLGSWCCSLLCQFWDTRGYCNCTEICWSLITLIRRCVAEEPNCSVLFVNAFFKLFFLLTFSTILSGFCCKRMKICDQIPAAQMFSKFWFFWDYSALC